MFYRPGDRPTWLLRPERFATEGDTLVWEPKALWYRFDEALLSAIIVHVEPGQRPAAPDGSWHARPATRGAQSEQQSASPFAASVQTPSTQDVTPIVARRQSHSLRHA
ncbi:MAG: hypothetical protein AB8I08_16300 [Sandaracinaceae bacterium]